MQPINTYIDYTLLKPEATFLEIENLIKEALLYQFASVCIHPTWTKAAFPLLNASNVKLCSVVGFPLGANLTETKALEAKMLVDNGVQEIDMVINIGALKCKDYKKVQKDIEAVTKISNCPIVKVIIETCLLTDEEKRQAALIIKDAGAHFVKTSTGFSKSGATIEDIALLRNTVGPNFGVKASGGVRDFETAIAMINAGATRIGTSSGVAIVQKSKDNKNSY